MTEKSATGLVAELTALLYRLPVDYLRVVKPFAELLAAIDALPEGERAGVRAAVADVLTDRVIGPTT